MKCLSPVEWRLGWLKSLLGAASFIIAVFMLQSRARGVELSLVTVFGFLGVFGAAYFWPAKVTLLEDGLTYTRYGFTRFIPYSQIRRTEPLQKLSLGAGKKKIEKESVWTVYSALRLHLEGGDVLEIGTACEELKTDERITTMISFKRAYGNYGAFDRNGWELKHALDARIERARDVSEPATPIAAGLMRGGKSVTEWLATLDAAAPARGDAYRGADGAHETLWRVLEDEASPREARAGAALALRSRLDEEGRHRMRVAIDTCESPKLRVALETALDEEASEPRLLHALEQASLPRDE